MCCRPMLVVVLASIVLAGSLGGSCPRAAAQQQQPDAGETTAVERARRHLAAGEFHLAQIAAAQLPAQQRGPLLGQLAWRQAATGAPAASTDTLVSIADPAARSAAVQNLRTAAAGGGTMADFATLMQLISSTVVPDTWDQLGGPSTMAPYPGGIFVDAGGVIHETQQAARGDALPAIRQLLREGSAAAADDVRDWTAAAALRCVSLRRLSSELVRLRIACQPMPPSMQNLAGISDVRYLIIDRQGGDVILAGPVGGIDVASGWPQDQHTGQTALQLPYLTAAMQAVLDRRAMGCSIDPTPPSVAAALDVAQQIRDSRIPLAHAADRLSQALGRQQVTVFGTPPDTPLAWLLVEADRHMKQLALGQHPMPEGVANYLDMVDAHIDQGPPAGGQLLRMWFTAAPMEVRADTDRSVLQVSGVPLRLATENQVPDPQGRRQAVADDPRAVQFAAQFNTHFAAIAARYPVYAALASVYRAAGVAALLNRHTEPAWLQTVCGPLLDDALVWPARLPAPKQVDSIAVMHQVRHAGRRVHVLVASGGVSIDPQVVVGASADRYGALTSAPPPQGPRPAAVQRWWWDVR